ncbi:hypothetical protein O23A_p1230 [Aeromonas salmonicida]|nr:hypothetical protein O23A_p1230 [Aeromonas salmonicida]
MQGKNKAAALLRIRTAVLWIRDDAKRYQGKAAITGLNDA